MHFQFDRSLFMARGPQILRGALSCQVADGGATYFWQVADGGENTPIVLD